MSCVICHMCLWKCLWHMSYICHRHGHMSHYVALKNMRWEIKNAKEWNKKMWDARLKKCKVWDITCEMHGWLVPGCLEKCASKKCKMRDVKCETRDMRNIRLKWRCEMPGKTLICQILDFWYCILEICFASIFYLESLIFYVTSRIFYLASCIFPYSLKSAWIFQIHLALLFWHQGH